MDSVEWRSPNVLIIGWASRIRWFALTRLRRAGWLFAALTVGMPTAWADCISPESPQTSTAMDIATANELTIVSGQSSVETTTGETILDTLSGIVGALSLVEGAPAPTSGLVALPTPNVDLVPPEPTTPPVIVRMRDVIEIGAIATVSETTEEATQIAGQAATVEDVVPEVAISMTVDGSLVSLAERLCDPGE